MNPRRPRKNVSDSQNWEHQATIRREQAPQVMDGDLKPWRLYGLEGAVEPEPLEVMKDLFTRYRTVRGKATNNAYTDDALQRSCCAFIRRWNASRREGTSFTSWLDGREGKRDRHAIGDLRRRIYRMTCDEYHLCYVHVREGCPTCNVGRSRPVRQEWDDLVCTQWMPDHIRP